MEADRIKHLTRALRVVTALDERAARGDMDDAAKAALREAETAMQTSSGRLALAAFRAWQASGVRSFDPTGGPVRITEARGQYNDMAMRGARR